ncbi:MAG: SDR family oxidoreductase [Candidatus Pseudobacter hemicellulosilyticus]|uniref:SDR family oxidoreductase n=1 Tax=Candidatus Pseudobacter hemicellulosilyticus TaxID=3121375 RepID=A0AAJ5WX40_9BACT|nr:MAG: SDR family oxidoreductase [Pseudobacter sp.]
MKQQVWYVTGASRGLGLSLVRNLLAQGYRVAATTRNLDSLKAAVDNETDQFLPLVVNLSDEKSVADSIAATVEHFGAIDVLVNNAGYGLIGSLEELSDEEVRQNFEVNVFGSLNVIRHALPYMRRQQSGHIFNIASIGGFSGLYPGFGVYCATKFAVHGFSESLAEEVRPLGIKVTIVSPGYFRTSFLDASTSLGTPRQEIADYKLVREVQQQHQQGINYNQPGDPEKAAIAMIAIAQKGAPVLHLFLGQDAYDTAAAKIRLVQEELEAVRPLATATGIDA